MDTGVHAGVAVARLGNAPEGDYREWDKIKSWAGEIAAELDKQAT